MRIEIADVAVERVRPPRRALLAVSLIAHATVIVAATAAYDPVVRLDEHPVARRETLLRQPHQKPRRVIVHERPYCHGFPHAPEATTHENLVWMPPSDADVAALAAAGHRRAFAVLDFCIGEGVVGRARCRRSTRVRAWQVAPPLPACDRVAFVFTLCE